MGTLITFLIRTSPSRRRRSSQSISGKLQSALSSVPYSPPTNILRPWILCFSSAIHHSSIPQFHLTIILFYALHPLFNGHSRGLVGPLFPLGMPWSLGFCPLFHHSIFNGSATPLHYIDYHLHLSLSPSSNNWACHADCNITCFSVRKPLFERLSPRE